MEIDDIIISQLLQPTTGRETISRFSQTSFEPQFSIDQMDDTIAEFQEDPMVMEAFSKGSNLSEYARQIAQDLKQVEDANVLEYVKNCDAALDLNRQIEECGLMLDQMDKLLRGYQVHLGKVNEEIGTIQNQSWLLSVQMKNRVATEKFLGSLLDGILVSPNLIRKICEGEINEFFIQHLYELNSKLDYFEQNKNKKILAYKQVAPELERLTLKAVEKIREFLLKLIDSLKTPNTNIAMTQQTVLLKYKELFWFLMDKYPDVGLELHANYIAIASNYFAVSFEKYLKSVSRFQAVIGDKLDLIGIEENAKRGLFTGRFQKDKTNIFTLGDRLKVLTSGDPGLILFQVGDDKNQKMAYEAIFKSITRLLLDNASSEYIFNCEFFGNSNAPRLMETTLAAFNGVFDLTFKLLQTSFKQYADISYDAVGILLCIRLNAQNLRVMQRRRIPCLDNFLNMINIVLWPRYQAIIDMHIDSLKKAVVSKLFPTKDTHPHYIVRRYAEFCASILKLNVGYNDAHVVNSLTRLRTEVEVLMGKMAAEIPVRKLGLSFWISNIDLVLSILSEHTESAFDPEKQHFEQLLESKTSDFVNEELQIHIGKMMQFVTKAEQADVGQFDGVLFESIATDFNLKWRQTLSQLNDTVTQTFPNFQNGARVLHACLAQYVLFYKRFIALWEKKFGTKQQKVQPTGMQSVLVEVKKFRSTF
ncbi:Sac2 family-domain-containing protein [Gorgonomyces haynaldii]|nr:Sac2 family-domain-containing protein [Gorgonomyces haynaldii]